MLLFLLLQAAAPHDYVSLPVWVVLALVTVTLAAIGGAFTVIVIIVSQANRHGRLAKTVEDLCEKFTKLQQRAEAEGDMSNASRERFAKIEQLVEGHDTEIVNLRRSQHDHNNRSDIHVTQEWRAEVIKRFDKMDASLGQFITLMLEMRKDP